MVVHKEQIGKDVRSEEGKEKKQIINMCGGTRRYTNSCRHLL